MKTFKLISLHVLDGKSGRVEQKEVPITSGLIINMENPYAWYIEAIVDKEEAKYFQMMYEKKGNILVDVVITSKDNHPAAMITNVESVTPLSKEMSILLKGELAIKKDDLLADVLEDIVNEGFTGQDLIQEFGSRRQNLIEYSQRTLDELYDSLRKGERYRLE